MQLQLLDTVIHLLSYPQRTIMFAATNKIASVETNADKNLICYTPINCHDFENGNLIITNKLK